MSTHRIRAIAANLAALDACLREGATLAADGSRAADDGELNLAIGTVLPLERALSEAQALLGAALALHRSGR